MVYSSMEFCEKQGWSACIMNKATKVKKRRYKKGNVVFKMWEGRK